MNREEKNKRELVGLRNCGRDTENGKKRTRRAVLTVAGVMFVLLLAGCGKAEKVAETAGIEEAEGAEAADTENAGASEAEAAEVEAENGGSLESGTAEPGEAGGLEAEASEAEDEDRPITMADLLQENGNVANSAQPPELPETVLWFNATYACLTYTNGWDWRWVGGQEPTEDNADRAKYLLYSSWDVLDRDSGLETVDNLLEGGHRAKCRECMDNLQEWGFMDLSEQRFAEELTKIVTGERTDIDLGNVPGRYVVAYYMYHSGIEPEYIAAWDLCRVNQLYADYYLCGFMDYEEAMDASLENSLKLQKMYDSWDEMMSAYLMGYQFWQGDLEITDDSPTKERRSYYEMLKNSDDNPYELDWNMELKKSW